MTQSARAPSAHQALRLLSLSIRCLSIAFTAFFAIGLFVIWLRIPYYLIRSGCGSTLVHLVRWGTLTGGAESYESMICVIYVTWGIFLWQAARAPLKHKIFLDFTAAANWVHFGTMAILAIVLPGEHIHMVGDVLIGILALTGFTILWVPARRLAE